MTVKFLAITMVWPSKIEVLIFIKYTHCMRFMNHALPLAPAGFSRHYIPGCQLGDYMTWFCIYLVSTWHLELMSSWGLHMATMWSLFPWAELVFSSQLCAVLVPTTNTFLKVFYTVNQRRGGALPDLQFTFGLMIEKGFWERFPLSFELSRLIFWRNLGFHRTLEIWFFHPSASTQTTLATLDLSFTTYQGKSTCLLLW